MGVLVFKNFNGKEQFMGVGLTNALISSNIIKMWQVVNYVVWNG